MKLIALCGAAGAGKDTVADMLPVRKIAFSDALYEEVSQAWGVSIESLKFREMKEVPQQRLSLLECLDEEFVAHMWKCRPDIGPMQNLSPRQALQLWATEYRRSQDPDYWVKKTYVAIRDCIYFDVVVTDVRFPNEAKMIRDMGGQIWQVKRSGMAAGVTGHASDTEGDEFSPDRVIQNDGTLIGLGNQSRYAWDSLHS